jgi:hypothetical protein
MRCRCNNSQGPLQWSAEVLLTCSCCRAHVEVLNLAQAHVASAGRFHSLPAWLAQAPSFLVLQFFCKAQLATRALTMPARASAARLQGFGPFCIHGPSQGERDTNW